MNNIIVLLFFNVVFGVTGFLDLKWTPTNPAFDWNIYKDLLNPQLCQEQLAIIRNNTLLAAKFIESGLRLPKGISDGNLLDYGNYFQCLGINENIGTHHIGGKHCMIGVPMNQTFQLPAINTKSMDLSVFMDLKELKVDKAVIAQLQKIRYVKTTGEAFDRTRTVGGIGANDIELNMAVCIPKACTTEEWINGLLFNVSEVGFRFNDPGSCRINDDKPWVPADYVALVVFCIIGFLTLICTSYDVFQTVIHKNDRKNLNPLHTSFSLYTNTRRLTTFTKNPGALECLDGIRALSMAWVILGHTFSTYPSSRINLIEAVMWSLSIESTWVTAAPISVDTFFMLSGLLLVYTTAGKFTGLKLLKNVHLFYINRILRMFPLLAAAILIQASFLYRISDGPAFDQAAIETDKCRNFWWSTLLYVQNYFNTFDMCLGHSWYLAVDMQMYLLSPLVLFFVLGRKRGMAWTALSAGLLAFLIPSTVYNFLNEFPSSVVTAARPAEHSTYMQYYYVNTFTRAPPFCVGMMFGYLLHVLKGQKLRLSKFIAAILWIFVFVSMGIGIFAGHPAKSFDWDNQVMDSLINSFSRVIWSFGIGLMVVFCVHGYGGPLNWFFSLEFWKLPSRLSYGMYLFHFQIMFVTAGSIIAPVYFTQRRATYRFIAELSIAMVVSFVMTVLVDSPFSTIFKLFLGGGPRKPATPENKVKENGMNGVAAPNEVHKIDIAKL